MAVHPEIRAWVRPGHRQKMKTPTIGYQLVEEFLAARGSNGQIAGNPPVYGLNSLRTSFAVAILSIQSAGAEGSGVGIF
jgi:hypothetical protein